MKNYAENTALHHMNKLHLKYNQTENSYFKLFYGSEKLTMLIKTKLYQFWGVGDNNFQSERKCFTNI